ncbi:yippee zinc-binding/DNA-binding /Mis18, centromere assembly-domain-containing protein [Aspergillus cavernicola]|uniref:Yippee zinc-binding/DNA-binding /Mis18, centromere assembly-domain-containing protein n=1 Tax=Aspergillus cavernicola TaxID=176166 RepID=A0ABR4IZL0_9EURO
MFPRFLLPPSVFHTKKRNAGRSTSPTSLSSGLPNDENSKQDHVSCIRCSTCAAHIALTSQIVSKGFTGRHGRAYLVSAEPAATSSSSPVESLSNTLLGSPEPRHLVTGDHTVSDVNCVFCGSLLGWKYVSAEEESQRYKVGNFILETKKVITTATWDPPSYASPVESTASSETTEALSKTTYDNIEFDSQDEDECEDLFSGIWSPGLAARRRNRRVARNPSSSMLGIASC